MKGQRRPPAAVSSIVSKVLDDDNLLIEILLRVGFPTTLVRAALVCKRWLHHASDNEFLRRFRELYPPRLLGFYINTGLLHYPHFVPMLPQPPELATVINHVRLCLDTEQRAPTDIIDCRNGRIFTKFQDGPGFTIRVHSPLCAEGVMATLPPFPKYDLRDGRYWIWHHFLCREKGGDLCYFYVLIKPHKERTNYTAHVYMLQDGVWCSHRTLATNHPSHPLWAPKPVVVDDKIYVSSLERNIIVLDLTASSFSTIRLPQGVESGDKNTMFSRADDASSIYLIQEKELQLRFWLHKLENWLLVNTICLHEMLANLKKSDCTFKDDHTAVLRMKQVGDNVEFVFFQMGRIILYLDIKCRTLRKVYEMTEDDSNFSICPFKMICPPIFHAVKDDPSSLVVTRDSI